MPESYRGGHGYLSESLQGWYDRDQTVQDRERHGYLAGFAVNSATMVACLLAPCTSSLI